MTTQTIYPALRYADAPAAIRWLEHAFGIVPEEVYPGDGGTVAHAQLRAGRDLLMMGSTRNGTNTSPRALGGRGTTALYVHVDDIEDRFAKATAAKATIVRPLGGTDYDDSKTFTAEDPEGYVWAFGTYAAAPECDLSPCFRYDDAHRALGWMRDCGFAEKMVVPTDDGTIAHAEMMLGASVLMASTRREDDLAFDSPRYTRGTTGGLYIYVADPDAHLERVRHVPGTSVIRELEDMDYGSREFTIRDPEGNDFSFGTYRP